MNTLQYSILYAMIRPEINEQVSVGIVFCQNGEMEVKYSNAKLNAVKTMIPPIQYSYLSRTIKTMAENTSFDSLAIFDYLNRYSNNILAVSAVQTVRMDSPRLSKDKLYQMYVHRSLPSSG